MDSFFRERGHLRRVDAPFIQSPQDILAAPDELYDASNRLLEELLNRLIDLDG